MDDFVVLSWENHLFLNVNWIRGQLCDPFLGKDVDVGKEYKSKGAVVVSTAVD